MLRALLLIAFPLVFGSAVSHDASNTRDNARRPDLAPAKSITRAIPAKGTPRGDSLKGRITYDGDLPKPEPIKAMEMHKNRDCCRAGEEHEKTEQTWIVDKKTRGVANVVIWLEPPQGRSFTLGPEHLKVKNAELDQPHCAFVPHVISMFPAYRDGPRYASTGQKLIVRNSAPIIHNVKLVGDPLKNPSRNVTLPPKQEQEFEIAFQKTVLRVSCDIHPWMGAIILTFGHPFHAVTDRHGDFQIEGIPAGVELTVVGWHEAKKEFRREKTILGSGENKVHWKINK